MHFNYPEATVASSGASMTTLASRGQYDAGDLSCAAGGSAEETSHQTPVSCLSHPHTNRPMSCYASFFFFFFNL